MANSTTAGDVALRRFTFADAPRVQELLADGTVADTSLRIPHPYPADAATAWIATQAARFEQGTGAMFAITAGGELVGAMGAEIDQTHRHAEIGFWIGQPFWGRGYCTAALVSMIRVCFGELHLHRVHAHHFLRNAASGRVMQKAGMQREGLLREHVLKNGRYDDIVIFGLLEREWRTLRTSELQTLSQLEGENV